MPDDGFRLPANSPKETTEALARLAKDPKGPNVFRMKVSRRRSAAMAPTTIAVFDEALAEHFAFPETWLSLLAGGGEFFLSAFVVEGGSAEAVGVPLPHTINGEIHEVDPSVTRTATWPGPRGLSFPTAQKPRMDHPQASLLPGGGVTSPTDASGAARQPGVRFNGAEPPMPNNGSIADLAAKYDELHRRERMLQEQANKTELDAVKREFEARLSHIEAEKREVERLLRMQQLTPPAPPAPPSEDRLSSMLEKLTPLIAQVLKESSSQRMEVARLQVETQLAVAKAQAEAQAQAAKAQAEAQAQAAKAQSDMLNLMLTRKDDSAVAMRSVLEAAAAQSKSQAEVAGLQTQTMINLVASMAEMGFGGGGGGEEESGFVKGIREVVRAVGSMMAAQGRAAQSAATAARRQLPRPARPAAPPPGAPQRPAPARPPAPPKPSPPPSGSKPAPDELLPIDDDMLRPPPPPPPPPAPPAMGDSRARPRVKKPSAIQRAMRMIHEKQSEPAKIAAFFIANIGDPSVAAALEAAEEDIGALLAKYLPAEWLDDEDNAVFVRDVVAQVLRQGVAAGIIPDAALEQAERLEGLNAEAEGEEPGDDEEEDGEGEDAPDDSAEEEEEGA